MARAVQGVEIKDLMGLVDQGKKQIASGVIALVATSEDGKGSIVVGVTPDLARELAKRLNVPVELINFDAAGKVFEALKRGEWDIAFMAIDPVRAAEIDFTGPYVLIEGAYVVPKDSPIKANEEVDRDGIRVAAAKGSAYELYLTRTLKKAKVVMQPTGPEACEMFLRDKLEVAAGVKQPMTQFANEHPETRLLPGRFMAIEQAMGMPKGRDAGVRTLREFVEEMKASGFVARALERSGQNEAVVAPPTPVP